MSVELYYFSGTGNALHVARELQHRIPGTSLVPIIQTLNQGRIRSSADIVGVIFPIHAHTFPWVVKEWLKKIDLSSASYVFALSNRECADNVFSDINKILQKRQQGPLDGEFMVQTPENFIPIFAVPTEEEIQRLETDLQSRLDIIQQYIINKKPYHGNTSPLINVLANTLLRLSHFLFQNTRYFKLAESYYANDKCTGCGICEKVCLANKIELIDKKPSWKKDVQCTYCFACISYCPFQAIQAKHKRTEKKGRYHHPEIKPNDIAEQKNAGFRHQ